MDLRLHAVLIDLLAYVEATGLAESTFGRYAVGDATFLPRLREGRVSVAVVDRALAFIAANPPPASDPSPVSRDAA